ncbi:DUF2853 family protein [Sandarakinorhabdus sp. DWP1-3-1]|uniref:DUF2853 family protein n=1 Tax=Sandarakinorhabdus sp. DWP1-3-1 TaxID=2804627 RepID=UPI003CEC8635
MDEDWAADVRKHAPGADEGAIAGIVRYCGIALRNRDSALVSFSDPAETGRVRENYLKKKLGLTDPDSDLDAAIAGVGAHMGDDPTRNRVTVYYLLADRFGKLGLFGGGAAAPVATAAPAGAVPLMAVPAAAVPAATPATAKRRVGAGLWPAVPLLLLLLSAIGLFWIISRGHPGPAAAPAAADSVVAPAAAPAAPAIPVGMGLTQEEIDGVPSASVYFDTAKTDVSPEIVGVAARFKAYLADHAGAKLAVSGYNDPRGDAAMNAELSKNRAMAVRDALVANGIAVEAIDLVKPEATSDTTTSLENARRVDINVV